MDKTFTLEIETRWSDIDAYGHVNNVSLFRFLEIARVKILQREGFDFLNGSVQTLVARAECDYLKPILISDRVVVSMEVSRIGNSSFDLGYLIHNGEGGRYATAKTVMVCFDPVLNNTVAVPQMFRRMAGQE